MQIQKLQLRSGTAPVFDALMAIHKSETDLWPKFDVSMSYKNCLKLGFDSSRTKSFEVKLAVKRGFPVATSFVIPLRVRSIDVDLKMIT